MENQHRHITGYRDLTVAEIGMMNEVKVLGARIGKLVDDVEQFADADKRWAAIARTQLQQGFMALTRAIAKPTTF